MSRYGKNIKQNQHFGELTAIRYVQTRGKWYCKCSCGKSAYIRADKLLDGSTKSCGHLKSKGGITKDPYYEKWKYHLRKGNNPHFDDIEAFKEYYISELSCSQEQKLKTQWKRYISKDNNGDFKDMETYIKWGKEQGYIPTLHRLQKEIKGKPHSKKNTLFGFTFNGIFLTTKKCRKLGFHYDKKAKMFYGTFKILPEGVVTTHKHNTFESMYAEYCVLYKRYTGEDFILY